MNKLVVAILIIQEAPAHLVFVDEKPHHIIEDDSAYQVSLKKCAHAIADHHFLDNEIIEIVFPNLLNKSDKVGTVFDRILFHTFYSSMKWTIVSKKVVPDLPRSRRDLRKPHNYIIQITEEDDLLEILEFLKPILNTNARFMFVITDVENYFQDNLQHFNKMMWTFKITKFVYVVPSPEYANTFGVYDWFPYENGNCGNNYEDTKLLTLCSDGLFYTNTSLFVDKIPDKLNGCPVRVRTVIWPPYIIAPEKFNRSQIGINFTKGLEISLLNLIAEKANFTIVYTLSNKTLDWGFLKSEGISTGMFNAVISQEVDIGIGALAATNVRYIHLDPSLTYTSESLTWCLPRALLSPKWMNIFLVLSARTWFCTIISLIVISLTIWVFSYKNNEEISLYKTFNNCAMNVLAVLISLSVKQKPISGPVRLIFLIWSLACLILAAIYQTYLINFLVKPHHEKQINTVEKLLQSNLPFGYLEVSRFYFGKDNSSVQKILKYKAITCYDTDKCLHNIAYKRNYSMLISRMFLMNTEIDYSQSRSHHLLYWFKENYISYPVQLLSYRGFPLLPRINDLISRIIQTGLMSKWESEIKMLFKKRHEEFDKNNNDDLSALDFSSLQGAFIVYAIGICISFIVFILELVLYKYKKFK